MKHFLHGLVLSTVALCIVACSVPPTPSAQVSGYSQTVEGLYVYSLIEENHEKLEVHATKHIRKALSVSNLNAAFESGEASVPEERIESRPDTLTLEDAEPLSSETFAAAKEAGTTQVLVIRQLSNGTVTYTVVDPMGSGFGTGRLTRFDVTLHDVKREEVVWRTFLSTMGGDDTASRREGEALVRRIVELLVRDGLMPPSVLKALEASLRIERP